MWFEKTTEESTILITSYQGNILSVWFMSLWQTWSPGCSSVSDSPTVKLLSSIHTIWTFNAEKNAIWKTFLNSPQISEWENYIWCRNLQKCFCHKIGRWVADLCFHFQSSDSSTVSLMIRWGLCVLGCPDSSLVKNLLTNGQGRFPGEGNSNPF